MAKDQVTTDALDDALASLGSAVPEGKLPTPAEMEAMENAAAEGTEVPPAAEAESTVVEDDSPVAIDLDALNEKIEKNEDLTPEEQKALDNLQTQVEKNEKESKPDKSYKVAGKEFSFAEKEAEMRKEQGIEDLDIPAPALEKMVDTYVKAQNREEQHVATSERAKHVAQEQKKIDAEQSRLATEKARIEYDRSRIAQEKARITRVREKLEKKANADISETDIVNSETGLTDPLKLTQYQDKLRAQEQLEEVTADEQEIEAQEREIVARYLHTSITNLQLANPQYRTSEDIRVIAQKLQKGEQVAPEDEVRALALFSMANDASTMKITLDKVFASRKAEGRILPEVAQSNLPTRPGPSKSRESIQQQVAALRAKIKRNPNLAAPSGAGQRGTGKKRPSQVLVEQERAARGDGEVDEFARSGWYK